MKFQALVIKPAWVAKRQDLWASEESGEEGCHGDSKVSEMSCVVLSDI